MNYEKVFVIGFNKTGTSTFHILFERNGLSSQHNGSKWDVEDFQCFSDNGNKRDWRNLSVIYPKSIFVLNTRPVEDWIRSRAKHCYVEKLNWGYPPSTGLYMRWILERNDHYENVLRHFENSPDRLIIVDISQNDWIEFVARRIGLEGFALRVNQSSEDIPENHISQIDWHIDEAMRELNVPGDAKRTSFLLPLRTRSVDTSEAEVLLYLYENNLHRTFDASIC